MRINYACITGQRQVAWKTEELDESLAPEEVLIKTEYTYISAGTELSIYTGVEDQALTPGHWCSYPYVPGYANVGRVLNVGSAVKDISKGQRVFSFGPHASYARRSTIENNQVVTPVPDGVHPTVAAASRMAGVAYTALHLAHIRPDAWVAVFGLGAIGNLAAQLFGLLGCRVIGIDPNTARRSLAEKCGVHFTLGGSSEEVARGILDLTGGKRVEIAVDAVGHSKVILQCEQNVADYGQIILLGTPRAEYVVNMTPLMKSVHSRWIIVRGALEWCLPNLPQPGASETYTSKQQKIFDWINRGLLHVQPLISHCLPADQIQTAYEGLLNQGAEYTGVVLDWTRISETPQQ